MNPKWKFIYLGRRPSPSPLLSPDVLAEVDVVDLKLSNKALGKLGHIVALYCSQSGQTLGNISEKHRET